MKEDKIFKKIKFLKVSGLILKIIAWVSLFLGLTNSISLLFGKFNGYPQEIKIVAVLAGFLFFGFVFFLFYTIAVTTDVLINTKKEE